MTTIFANDIRVDGKITIANNNTCTSTGVNDYVTVLTKNSLSEAFNELSKDDKISILKDLFMDFIAKEERNKIEALLELNENYDKQYITKQVLKSAFEEILK